MRLKNHWLQQVFYDLRIARTKSAQKVSQSEKIFNQQRS